MACACQHMTMGGGVDGGECDQILSVHLSGEEVELFKARLDPWFSATDVAVQTCPALPEADRAAWSLFLLAWQGHRAVKAGFWSAGSQWRATCSFARQLDAWREKIDSMTCTIPGPVVIDPPQAHEDAVSAVKWIAAAVIVAAVAVGVKAVL